MALTINHDCTACGLCLPECPIDAITEGDFYNINPDICDECENKDDGPQCVAACPVDCISHLED